MVPIRRNVVLEALGLINQGSASAKPRGSAPWVIDHGRRLGHQRPERMVGVGVDMAVDQYRTVTGHVPLYHRIVAKEQV